MFNSNIQGLTLLLKIWNSKFQNILSYHMGMFIQLTLLYSQYKTDQLEELLQSSLQAVEIAKVRYARVTIIVDNTGHCCCL